MYNIGQFSKLSRLSVKMLRHYHEIGLLVPDEVDGQSGYRRYGPGSLERARIIHALKEVELPLKDIQELVEQVDDDVDLVAFLEGHRREIEAKVAHYQAVKNSLDALIASARMTREVRKAPGTIDDKSLEPLLFAGVRMRGEYIEIQRAFATVGRRAGMKIAGPAQGLFYDEAYQERDADFEGGFPVRAPVRHADVDCRELEGGRALTTVHTGPYDTLHATYERLVNEMNRLGVQPIRPSREVYLRGPGMIFRGNPAKYRTEIQFLVA